jgi:hypothetical protein
VISSSVNHETSPDSHGEPVGGIVQGQTISCGVVELEAAQLERYVYRELRGLL